MQHGTLSVTLRTQNFVSSQLDSLVCSTLRLLETLQQFNNVCWMLCVFKCGIHPHQLECRSHALAHILLSQEATYQTLCSVSIYFNLVQLTHSINVPYLMKEFIKDYCTSSAVKRRAVWGIWNLHAWAALILPWEEQIVTQIAKGETDGVAVLLCLSQAATPTDWLTSVIVAQKNHFFQQSQRCCDCSQLGCLIQPYLLPPSGPKTPCGRWRRDSAATRTIEKWCWRWRWELLVAHVKLPSSSISVVRQKWLRPWPFLSWFLK